MATSLRSWSANRTMVGLEDDSVVSYLFLNTNIIMPNEFLLKFSLYSNSLSIFLQIRIIASVLRNFLQERKRERGERKERERRERDGGGNSGVWRRDKDSVYVVHCTAVKSVKRVEAVEPSNRSERARRQSSFQRLPIFQLVRALSSTKRSLSCRAHARVIFRKFVLLGPSFYPTKLDPFDRE